MTDPRQDVVMRYVHSFDQDIAAAKANVARLEGELAQAKAYLAQLEAGKAGVEGRGVDQAALRRARSLWAQAKRRHKEFPNLAEYGPEEIKRLEREYKALKAKS